MAAITSVVVALLLTVAPAQDKNTGDTVDNVRRLGEIANDLADVRIQIRKAKLDIEQANLIQLTSRWMNPVIRCITKKGGGAPLL